VTASWAELVAADPALADLGRSMLLNCAATWGIGLLGTTRLDGSPRVSPLCIYIVEDRLLFTLEGLKERDLQRDERCFLHSYWGREQDEFAVSGAARRVDDRDRLDRIEPRLSLAPVLREMDIASVHAVVYKNFPTPEMYAEVAVWKPGSPTRRWTREDPAVTEPPK
jgi:hypothetical protein